jgi:hypothetical protein
MPVTIGKEAFVNIARRYVYHLLGGICDGEVLLATDPQPQTVRIVVKLTPTDFQAIKFSDIYLSAQKMVRALGARHLDPATNEPHNAELKLYDPYFESLDFQPVEAPD